MNRVVDDYGPVADGLENDIDEIEVEVFGGDPGVSRRIYELSREVIQFHQATQPLAGALGSLAEDGMHDAEVRSHLRDLRDRALRVTERVEGFRELLQNILTVNFTMVGIQQSDQTKKISAWAAIVIAPTLIAGIYGMNFDYMPELHWRFGYPFALSLMVLAAFLLYLSFKRSGWL
jgi:magnesium transporter